MRRDLITLLLAWPAYMGYYLASDPWVRGWIYYAMTGALTGWLAWQYRPAHWIGRLAVTYTMIEAAQQAGCGALTAWGPPSGGDVCVVLIGPDAYRAGLSAVIAALIVWGMRWPSPQAPS